MMNFKSGAELLNAAKEINGEMKAGKLLEVAIGAALLGLSIYAFALSIKANKMSIKRMEEAADKDKLKV
jgi:hypothetical protein